MNWTTVEPIIELNSFNASLEPEPAWKQRLHLSHRIILILILVYIMLAMGCTISFSEIWLNLRRPLGIVIGAVCQFVVMPLIAFGLVHALKLDEMHALGMLLLASSPGGGLSNIFTYWADGDVSLSICMTSVSTVLALGLMPLNLYIYTRGWSDVGSGLQSPANTIPYKKIFITLASILGPVAIGTLIRRKSPKVANFLAKLGSVAGLMSIGTVITMQSVLYRWHHTTDWKLWTAAIIHPLAAYFIGYILAWICRTSGKHRKTIAFETGSQNVALALSVVAVSFSPELTKDLIVYPILFGIFMPLDAIVLIGVRVVYMWICKEKTARKEAKYIVGKMEPLLTNGVKTEDIPHKNGYYIKHKDIAYTNVDMSLPETKDSSAVDVSNHHDVTHL